MCKAANRQVSTNEKVDEINVLAEKLLFSLPKDCSPDLRKSHVVNFKHEIRTKVLRGTHNIKGIVVKLPPEIVPLVKSALS
jgi:hypothetical protein